MPKIVTCLTTKCENEGSLSDKDVSGSLVTRSHEEFVKNRGHWVKVGKNGGLSVKASEKSRVFWWHMARNFVDGCVPRGFPKVGSREWMFLEK